MPREFSVGSVLNLAFSGYFRNFVPFTVIAYVVGLPLTLWSLAYRHPEYGTISSPSFWLSFGVGWLLTVTLSLLMTATMVYGVFQQLHGVPVRISDCVGAVMSRLGVVLGVSIVTGLAITLASFFCLVPGIIAACTFFVAVPAALVERIGVGASVDRSRDLTSGHRWQIFGIIFVLGAISIVLTLVETGFRALLGPVLGSEWVADLLAGVITAAGQALYAVAVAVAYYLLRVTKEGFEIRDLAEVFS